MRKSTILIILLTILAFSCNQSKEKDKEKNTNDQKISIDINQIKECKMNTLFNKIELVPLETKASSIIGKVGRVVYVSNKYYIILDGQSHITVFNKNGTFISNSSAVEKGRGPKEYYIVLCIAYNQYSNTIEILSPDRNIIVYDTLFRFIERKKIKITNDIMYYYFYPINKDVYALMPTPLADNPNIILFWDSKKKTVIKEIKYKNVISRLTQTEFSIRSTGSNYYFGPASTTYYGYSMDCKSLSLNPIFHFDFGKNNIDIKGLNRFKDCREVADYLFKSSYPLPLRNLFNEKYIVSSIKMKDKFYTFIYNRQTSEKQLVKNKYSDKLKAPQYFTIENNILFAIIQPYELSKYVDIKLLNKNDKKVFDTILEDDNPVIVKYFLK